MRGEVSHLAILFLVLQMKCKWHMKCGLVRQRRWKDLECYGHQNNFGTIIKSPEGRRIYNRSFCVPRGHGWGCPVLEISRRPFLNQPFFCFRLTYHVIVFYRIFSSFLVPFSSLFCNVIYANNLIFPVSFNCQRFSLESLLHPCHLFPLFPLFTGSRSCHSPFFFKPFFMV